VATLEPDAFLGRLSLFVSAEDLQTFDIISPFPHNLVTHFPAEALVIRNIARTLDAHTLLPMFAWRELLASGNVEQVDTSHLGWLMLQVRARLGQVVFFY